MRAAIVSKIEELEEKHCQSCEKIKGLDSMNGETLNYCLNKCDVGKQMQELGSKLLDLSNEKARKIIEKGAEMTTNEALYLMDKGISRENIAKFVGGNQKTIGVMGKLVKVAESKNIKDAIAELSKEGYSPKQIQEVTDVPLNTIYKYRHETKDQWKAEERKVEEKKSVKPKNESESMLSKLQKRIKELEDHLEQAETVSLNQEHEIQTLQEKAERDAGKIMDLKEAVESLRVENKNLEKELEEVRNGALATCSGQQSDVEELEVRLKAEVKKREHLLAYLILDSQVQ